jgi:eukaryotic-like serine/threonine-protein kinase
MDGLPAAFLTALEGRYRVERELGEGGMAKVFLAHDLRHDRRVALKLLRPEFAAAGAQRFLTEIRTTANLQHPNILPLFDSGTADGLVYYVMPYVEGESLAHRLEREGQLPVEEAVAIAQGVAEALDYAHEQGVIHRDIKPANILLSRGRPLVADFGIALAVAKASGARLTETGVSLGTPLYMSPEQVTGERLPDSRSDVYALGCVLYEMLLGEPPHSAPTTQAVLGRILAAEPRRVRDVRRSVPPNVDGAVARALEKLPADRFSSAGDFSRALRDPGYRHGPDDATGAPAADRRRGAAAFLPPRRGRWAWAGAWAATLLAAVWITTVQSARGGREASSAEGRPVVRYSHELPAEQRFTALAHNVVAVSPDGATIVYEASGRLYRRAMAELEASAIRGTEGAPASPFFAPDGRTIAYWDEAAGELRRIPISGGTPVTITRAGVLYGGSWEADGSILFGQEDGVWRVPASGGTPEIVVPVESAELVYGPRMLPDGETLLFAITARASMFGQNTAWDSARVIVQSLRTGERREILRGGDPRYVPTGHLVYALDQNLYAVPFDLIRQEVRGGSVPVVEGIGRTGRGSRGQGGGANYDFSRGGSLVYVPAGPPLAGHPRQLLGVDPAGNAAPLIEEQRDYWRPRISPDGTRVAVEVAVDDARQIWIVHLASRTASPLVVGGGNAYPVWTADGEWVVFNSNRGGVLGTYRQRADGSGEAELLVEGTWPSDASRDGVLSLRGRSRAGPAGILTYDLRDGSLADFVATGAREHMARFSPDGRWLAYTSNESGRDEIYVRPYPRTEGVARLVSVGGGAGPVWAPDGSTLYFRGEGGDIMAVRTTTSPTFTAGRPQPVFRYLGRFRMSGTDVAYDIHPDGSRFIMVSELEDPTWFVSRVNIVQNWFEELKEVR